MRARKPVLRIVRTVDTEQMSTEEVVALHERLYAPLDAVARRRILERARSHGWDRAWEMDGLAA
jgi:hypothetical protein